MRLTAKKVSPMVIETTNEAIYSFIFWLISVIDRVHSSQDVNF